MSQIIAKSCIFGFYFLFLTSGVAHLFGEAGTFWYVPADTAWILGATAIAMHIIIYFDESFGLRK